MTPEDKTYILEQVVDYLYNKGVSVNLNELENNVKINRSLQNKYKFKVKGKVESKVKFKVSNKNKQLLPMSIYKSFTNICRENNIMYFRFNDEYDWCGPAIKVDNDDGFNDSIFKDIDIHVLSGNGFSIIRPTKHESDLHLSYDFSQYENCVMTDSPTNFGYNTDTPTDSDSDSETIDTEDWFFDPTNTLYQLDTKNNNVYSNQTYEFVGRKINDHKIDFDAKE